MAGLNLTTFDAMLKEHYTTDYVENMVYKDNALMALMPKYEDFGGRNLRVPLIYGNPQGRSQEFTQAQARGAVTSSQVNDFILTRVHDYGIATVDNETIEASKGDENAFLEALTTEIDGIINSLTRSTAIAMYGTGYGDIGVIDASTVLSGTTIQLAVVSSVTNFEREQELVVAQFATTGGLRALGSSGNGLIITGVDRANGILTFGFAINDATNGIPTIAAGDSLFVRGDRSASSTPPALKLSGLEAWDPASTPSSTLFFGVDRTADATRLGGQRINGVGLPIEEVLIEGASQVAQEGGKLDHYFMSYKTYSALEKALGSKVVYIDMKVNAEISFRGIQVNGPRGPINVVPDQNCPQNRIFGLQLNMWKLYSLGKAIRVIESDGLSYLRQSTADGIEVRYGGYFQMGCRGPGYNVNIQV